MDRSETIKIMAVLKAAYPNYYRGMDRNELDGVVNLWQSMFDEEPYPLVGAAVKAHISTDTKGFPPVIGQIKEAVRKLTQPEEMTELEAWEQVRRALSRSAYNSAEEFAALPESLRRIVGSPAVLREWSQLPVDEVQTVVASNFQRSYRARASHERERAALPGEVKRLMAEISTGSGLKRLGGGEP